MKTKNSSDIPVKIILVVVGVILVGIIVAWTMGVFKDKKNDLDESTSKINNAISEMADFDILVYDGSTISGKTLLKVMKEAKEKGITIKVATLSTPTPTEYSISPTPEPKVINPNASFKGEVVRDTNGNITEIIFTQQK